MEESKLEIPVLHPDEKIVGHAYLTEDGEIVYTPQSGVTEVVLVKPRAGTSGPWAVRRPRVRVGGAGTAP